MKIKRRDFLKLGAAAGAAVTVGKPVLNAFAFMVVSDVTGTGEVYACEVSVGSLPSVV